MIKRMIPEDKLLEDLKNLPLEEVLEEYDITLGELFKLQQNKQYRDIKTSYITETKSGTYSINKSLNGEQYYYGSYRDKREAKRIVEELRKCGWDIKELPRILKELNITSKTERRMKKHD